jgi:hypothetical protein
MGLDFRRFLTDMGYILAGTGREGHRSFVFSWFDWDWRISLQSSGKRSRFSQRFERVFTLFSLLISFVSASCSLLGLHGSSGRVSLPSAPPFSYVRSYVLFLLLV